MSYIVVLSCCVFFFTVPPPPVLYTLSLHDALPICGRDLAVPRPAHHLPHAALDSGKLELHHQARGWLLRAAARADNGQDRKSTRLNSSHQIISYAVFCLKKKSRARTLARRRQPAPA